MKILVLLVLIFVPAYVFLRGPTGAPRPEGWIHDNATRPVPAPWDDGMAEVAEYVGERVIYGESREHEVHLLTVKETMDPDTGVKSDRGRGLEVLKQNIVSRVPTPFYDYHLMASVFVRRDAPTVLMKLTTTSQEWCGTTLHQVLNFDHPALRTWRSYWDGEGNGRAWMDLRGDTFLEDQLHLGLRSVPPDPDLDREIRLLPSLISNRARTPTPRTARLVGLEERSIETAAGNTVRCHGFEVSHDGWKATWWFHVDPPHVLVSFRSSDGRSLLLRSWERRAYWPH